jgi:hypothetical protein
MISSPHTAEAIIIDYTFDGTITNSGTSYIPIGSNFSGSFSIDYDAHLTDVLPNFSIYQNALLNYNVSINGNGFQPLSPNRSIQVSNSGIDIVDIPGPFFGHAADLGFGFHNSTPFADRSLANYQYLNQLPFNSKYFYIDIFGLNGNYQTEVTGDIRSIKDPERAPVPEPSTFAFFISGLAGFGVWRIRRRQS